jgi:hypothetical protein
LGACPSALPHSIRHAVASDAIAEFFMVFSADVARA